MSNIPLAFTTTERFPGVSHEDLIAPYKDQFETEGFEPVVLSFLTSRDNMAETSRAMGGCAGLLIARSPTDPGGKELFLGSQQLSYVDIAVTQGLPVYVPEHFSIRAADLSFCSQAGANILERAQDNISVRNFEPTERSLIG